MIGLVGRPWDRAELSLFGLVCVNRVEGAGSLIQILQIVWEETCLLYRWVVEESDKAISLEYMTA